jgi:MFS family permease
MNRNLILIMLSLFTWGLGETMFYDFRPLYLQQMGADPVLIGMILGAVGVAMAFSHLPAGYLSDRIGRRPMLWASWIMGIIAAILMAAADSIPLFVIGAVFYGLTYFVSGPLSSYITAGRGSLSVGRVLTIVYSSFSVGGILGPIIGGWLSQTIGLRGVIWVASAIFIVSTIIIFFISSQPVENLPHEQHHNLSKDIFSKRYLGFIAIIFFAMFAMYLPQPLTPNYLQNQRGISLAQIGQLLSLTGVGVLVFNLVLGHFNARYSFMVPQIALGLFSFLIWQGTGLPWYLCAFFLMGSHRTSRSLAAAQGRTMLHDGNMGLGYGMIEAAVASAVIVAPPIAGFLYTQNPNWIYAFSVLLAGVALLITIFFMPVKAEDVQ